MITLVAWWGRSRRSARALFIASVIGLVSVLGLVVLPERAQAFDICKDAPPATFPNSGRAALLFPTPNMETVPEEAPDPFSDTTIPVSDVYGFTWRWTNYDLGCGNDFLADPAAVTSTMMANQVMQQQNDFLANASVMESMAKGDPAAWLKPVLNNVASKLSPVVMTGFIPLVMMAAGLVVIWRANRQEYAETFSTAIVALAAIVVGVLAFNLPSVASAKMDQAMKIVTDAVENRFSGSGTDQIVRESAMRSWQVGAFCSADSPTAKEFTPRVVEATTLSWSDVKKINADPAQTKPIMDAKAERFKTTAAELKEKDPGAYGCFTGQIDYRLSNSWGSLGTTVLMLVFAIVAWGVTIIAKMMIHILILVGALGVIFGVIKRETLSTVFDAFIATLWGTAKFTIASGATVLALAGIREAEVGGGWKIVLMIIFTLVMLFTTKPIRTVKAMIPGVEPNRSLMTGMLGRALGLLGTAIAVRASVRQGGDDGSPKSPPTSAEESGKADTPTRQPRPALSSDNGPAALPAPHYTKVNDVVVERAHTVPAADSRQVWVEQVPNPTSQSQDRWEGLVGRQGTNRALPAAPAASDRDADAGAGELPAGNSDDPPPTGPWLGSGGRGVRPVNGRAVLDQDGRIRHFDRTGDDGAVPEDDRTTRASIEGTGTALSRDRRRSTEATPRGHREARPATGVIYEPIGSDPTFYRRVDGEDSADSPQMIRMREEPAPHVGSEDEPADAGRNIYVSARGKE